MGHRVYLFLVASEHVEIILIDSESVEAVVREKGRREGAAPVVAVFAAIRYVEACVVLDFMKVNGCPAPQVDGVIELSSDLGDYCVRVLKSRAKRGDVKLVRESMTLGPEGSSLSQPYHEIRESLLVRKPTFRLVGATLPLVVPCRSFFENGRVHLVLSLFVGPWASFTGCIFALCDKFFSEYFDLCS